MRLFSWQNKKFKILNITVFKMKGTSKGIYFYLFGIPVYRSAQALSKLIAAFKTNKDFDVRRFDEQSENLAKPFEPLFFQKESDKIGYLVTEIYDMGGHTKCIKDLVCSLSDTYHQTVFLTRKTVSLNNAPAAVRVIEQHAEIEGTDDHFLFFRKKCREFCQKITSHHIKVLLVYIHPDDIFGTAVLSYLKRMTDIKIIYFNHASHFPVLGMSFADVILEGMPITQKITNEKRHFSNTKIIGIQSLPKNATVYYSKMELEALRHDLGIRSDELITMSGGSSYKFFDDENHSAYFEMIKRLLGKEPRVKHIVISQFKNNEKRVIDAVFSDQKELKDRLIIVPYQTNFDKWFQMADVFIDSFPVSSALTQIDLMRNKVASVVKINRQVPYFSFHEYQMPDYPYMFEKVEDMEKAVLDLLHDKAKRQEIINRNYDFWLKTYEANVFKDKIIAILEK